MATKKRSQRNRSQAAKLGWKRRRLAERNERRAIQDEGKSTSRSDAAKLGWMNRRLREQQDDFRHEVEVRREMIRLNDVRWRRFLKRAQELGFSPQQARGAWFSPKAKYWRKTTK